jgi:hypothetical protein
VSCGGAVVAVVVAQLRGRGGGVAAGSWRAARPRAARLLCDNGAAAAREDNSVAAARDEDE